MSDPIVILGSGLAGYTVAREFRKLDQQTALVIVTADDGCFYSKPMLSNALAAGKLPAALRMKPADAMAVELNARIQTHTQVTGIDAAARRVVLGNGAITYSKLVLAQGADPVRLPLGGDGAADVMSVNDLAGYAHFREQLAGKRRVAILGAGLIGCEFANDLIVGGYEVDVIDIAAQPLGRLLPRAPADALRSALAAAGVRWHFGKRTATVDKTGAAYRIGFAGGALNGSEHRNHGGAEAESVEADLVLSAIGLAPRIGLARAAGLTVNRGIVVDNTLRTSDAHIYALGDCAEIEGAVLPFVLPIMHAARVLAPNLTGQTAVLQLPVMPVLVKTPALPVVVCPAPAGTGGHWRVEQTEGGSVARFVDACGRVSGFTLSGAATAQRQQLLKEMAAA